MILWSLHIYFREQRLKTQNSPWLTTEFLRFNLLRLYNFYIFLPQQEAQLRPILINKPTKYRQEHIHTLHLRKLRLYSSRSYSLQMGFIILWSIFCGMYNNICFFSFWTFCIHHFWKSIGISIFSHIKLSTYDNIYPFLLKARWKYRWKSFRLT